MSLKIQYKQMFFKDGWYLKIPEHLFHIVLANEMLKGLVHLQSKDFHGNVFR